MLDALILFIQDWNNIENLAADCIDSNTSEDSVSLFDEKDLNEIFWSESGFEPSRDIREKIEKQAVGDTLKMLSEEPTSNPKLKDLYPFVKEVVREFAEDVGRNPSTKEEARSLANTALTNFKSGRTGEFTQSRKDFYTFLEEYSYLESVQFHNHLVRSDIIEK